MSDDEDGSDDNDEEEFTTTKKCKNKNQRTITNVPKRQG